MNWNLKEFFNTEEDLQNQIQTTKNNAKNFNNKYKNKLSSLRASEFLECIQKYEKINEDISKISTYSFLKFAVDTTDGAQLAKIEKICDEILEDLLFFELEFNELDEKLQDEFIKECDDFSYFLALLKKQKSHQLSFLEERILLKTSPLGSRAFSRLFDETMAKMKFDFDGKLLSEEEILSLFHDQDRETRKKASKALAEELQKNSHLLTYIYNMIKTDLKISCDLRGYEFGEDIMHEHNQIQKQSVNALIKASENSFNLVGKFYEKKRQILGYEKLYDYDRYAPISNESEFSWDEAKTIVLNAFGEFSQEFKNIAQKAFDEGWIDAMCKENKQSGAFSHSGSKDTHPFVLLNFTNKRRDVFTLAHELGHALHQYLSYKTNFLSSHPPLTTAETASVFCEMLVFSYIKDRSNDEDKKAMLASKIEDIFATLYRQINFTTFERKIHASKDELSTEEMGKIWLEESEKMFDKKLILDEHYKYFYSYIPHFIHSPFYCYAYAYAQLLVLTLFGLYKSKKCENFVEIYTEFLSLGGSKSPKEMIAKFNLDINSNEFWDLGIKEVEKLVDEFINL